MRIELDTSSREPIYQQLVDRIQLKVAQGELADGYKLPSVRELALDLRINPNTVARAYRELETAGVVVRQHGRGVFVSRRTGTVSAAEQERQLAEHVDALLLAAWRLGLTPDQLIEHVRSRASGLFSQHSTNSRSEGPGGADDE